MGVPLAPMLQALPSPGAVLEYRVWFGSLTCGKTVKAATERSVMKKRLVSHLVLGLSLAALPFLGGCTQQNAGGSNPFVGVANAEPVGGENNLAAVTDAVTNAPDATAQAATNLLAVTNAPAVEQTNSTAQVQVEAMEPMPPTEHKPPSNVQLSPVLSEAVKLVQSTVDPSVLFNFITNTTGYFMLGADEIVYLNDLGVEGRVITAMMEHDKALRELRANAWQAAQAEASNQATQQTVQPEQPEPEVAAAPSYVEPPSMEAEPVYVSNTYFYDTLSPYGSWVYVPGYGRCWRPTVAACNPGWRPYCDRGRWVYSDCGWYWLSDYTWGATAFHYGRWFNDNRMGWCWYPDTVWAPSWVSWRYTSDYCGWAPLPPSCYYQSGFGLMYTSGSVGVSFGFGLGCSSYAFVPWGSFCSPRPYQHCLPAGSAVHVYNNSRPYNHWESGGSGKANNRGLAPDRVRDLSRTEVRTVSLKEQNGRYLRADRIERDGRTLTVRRPQFTSTSTDAANGVSSTSRPKAPEATVSTTPRQAITPVPSTLTPSTTGRIDPRNQREQSVASRTSARPVSPVTLTGDSTIESKPPVITPTRGENRTDRNAETETINRSRTISPVVVRPTQQQPVTLPVANVNGPGATDNKASQPRVIQPSRQTTTRPSTPAPRSSIIVIGNGNNNRSGGRDYSVWSTPSQSPAPSSPRDNVSPRNTQPATTSTPASIDNSTAPVVGAQNGNWQNRGNNNRPDNSGSTSSYSAPQAGQVSVPTTRPTTSANYNARPTQPAPTQDYAARPQPSAQPSAARVESRPAPAPAQTRSSAPATSSAGQIQGRPNR